MKRETLVDLWTQMAALTVRKCAACKPRPYSCCSREYCEMARAITKDEYNMTLTDLPRGRLPFLSATGCIVPPHMRPLCTLHVCSINALGFDLRDPNFTDEYFKLREAISELQIIEEQE